MMVTKAIKDFIFETNSIPCFQANYLAILVIIAIAFFLGRVLKNDREKTAAETNKDLRNNIDDLRVDKANYKSTILEHQETIKKLNEKLNVATEELSEMKVSHIKESSEDLAKEIAFYHSSSPKMQEFIHGLSKGKITGSAIELGITNPSSPLETSDEILNTLHERGYISGITDNAQDNFTLNSSGLAESVIQSLQSSSS